MKCKKSEERIKQEKRENPARSDFKVYQFGRDDGRRTLEFQRWGCSSDRINRGKKWKPK